MYFSLICTSFMKSRSSHPRPGVAMSQIIRDVGSLQLSDLPFLGGILCLHGPTWLLEFQLLHLCFRQWDVCEGVPRPFNKIMRSHIQHFHVLWLTCNHMTISS